MVVNVVAGYKMVVNVMVGSECNGWYMRLL